MFAHFQAAIGFGPFALVRIICCFGRFGDLGGLNVVVDVSTVGWGMGTRFVAFLTFSS